MAGDEKRDKDAEKQPFKDKIRREGEIIEKMERPEPWPDPPPPPPKKKS